jgi:lipopolysaccharide transport protein LptA
VNRSISSGGPLSVKAAGGKFSVEGVGFLWRQTNSSLAISNRVHTKMHPELLESPAGAATPIVTDDKGLDVTSDQFFYSADANLAVYREHVLVAGTNLALNCGRLTIGLPSPERQLLSISASNDVTLEYGDIRANSQEALYSPAEDTIRLKGQPAWHVGGRGGTGDELVLERTNLVLRALGHASLTLPGHDMRMSFLSPSTTTNANHEAGTNHVLEIQSASYELRTNGAVFQGGVIATQRNGEQKSGTMQCGTMTIALKGTNELERLVATENVEITQNDQGLRAGKAVYTGTNSLLELSEAPKWFAGTSKGHGDLILVTEGAMEVKGNAEMQLPANQLVGSGIGIKGPHTKTNWNEPRFALIHSRNYRLMKETARFQGHVTIEHPQMNWTSETLTVHFPSQGQVDKVEAETDVAFDLTDDQGRKVHGTGQEATYTYAVTPKGTNDLIELSGDPVLVTSYGTFRNRTIVFDRAQNKLLARGGYSVLASPERFPTNQFVVPKFKLKR